MKFVAIDFETTGLIAKRHRVVEIGLVRFSDQFQVEAEFSSLVNPSRDVGRTDIHGITPSMLEGAPTFDAIAADVCQFISGSILVAHNKQFDLDFLAAELLRAGMETPHLDAVCTIELVRSAYPSSPRRLHDACRYLDIEPENAHEALADARMAANIAIKILRDVGFPALPDPVVFPRMQTTSSSPTKTRQSHHESRPNSYLADLVAKLPETTLVAGREVVAANEYLNLLDRVIEDRVIDEDEATLLALLAGNLGLSANAVRMLHSSYLYALCRSARADGQVSESERRDIRVVAEELNLENWEELLNTDFGFEASYQQPERTMPIGTRVCFTGQMDLSRSECESQAARKGLIVCPRVAKDVEVLVVADPRTQSTKARLARKYGARIMSERAFFREIENYPDAPGAVAQEGDADNKFNETERVELVIEIGGHIFSQFGRDEVDVRMDDIRFDLTKMVLRVTPSLLPADALEERFAHLTADVRRVADGVVSVEKGSERARDIVLDVWGHIRAVMDKWDQPTISMLAAVERMREITIEFVGRSQLIPDIRDPDTARWQVAELIQQTVQSLVEIEPRVHHSALYLREMKLRNSGVIPNDSLQGMSIVVTGDFKEFEREEAYRAIFERGGKSPFSVSGRTYALIAGEHAGWSKLEKALTVGTPVVGYAEFLTILDQGELPNVPKRVPTAKPAKKVRAGKTVETPEGRQADSDVTPTMSDSAPMQQGEDVSDTVRCDRCGRGFPKIWATTDGVHKCPECRGIAGNG